MKKVNRVIGYIIFITLIFGILFYMYYKKTEEKIYTDISYEELGGIIDNNADCYIWVYSPTCGTCKKLTNDIKELNSKMNILANREIYGLNIDNVGEEYKNVLKKFGTEGVPFIVHFKNGIQDNLLYEDITKNDIKNFFSEEIVEKKNLELVFFYSPTCGSCEKVSNYLDEISNNNGTLQIHKYNVMDANTVSLLNEYCEYYNVHDSIVGSVPIIFIRNTYIYDKSEILSKLEEVIEDTSRGDTRIIQKSNVSIEKEKKLVINMELLKLICVALINGLNPCSISALLFLLVLIEVDVTKVLKIGLSFCAGKMLIFILLGTFLYRFMSYIHSSIIISVINLILAFLLFVLASLNLHDFFVIRKGEIQKIRAQLPKKIRKVNHLIISNVLRGVNNKWLIISGIGLGVIIGFTEFLCSGQIYLFSIITIIHIDEELIYKSVIYLVIYCFVFILPLASIVLLVFLGKKTGYLSVVLGEKVHVIKLINAITFLVLALFMVFSFF